MQVHTTPGSNVSKLRHLFEAPKPATATQPGPVRRTKPLNRSLPTTNGIANKAPSATTAPATSPSNTAFLKQNAPKSRELNSNIKSNVSEELNSSITDKSVDPHTRFAFALKRFEKKGGTEQLDEQSTTHKRSPPSSPPPKKPFSHDGPPSSDGEKENKPIKIETKSISTTRRSPDYNPFPVQLGGGHGSPKSPTVISDYHSSHKGTNSNESSPTRDLSKNRKNNTYNANLENERLSPKTSPRRSPPHLSSPNHSASDIIALQKNVDLSKELDLELEGSGESQSEGDRRSPSSPLSPLSKKFPSHGKSEPEVHEVRRGFRKYSQEPEEEKITSTESESTHTSMSDVTVEEREVIITPKTVAVEECAAPMRLDNISSEDIEFADAIPEPDIPEDEDDTFQSQEDSMEDFQKEALLQDALRGYNESDNTPQRVVIGGTSSRSAKMAIALSLDESNVDDDDEYDEEGEESEYTDHDISKGLDESTDEVKSYDVGVTVNSQRFIQLTDTGLEDESMEAMDEENSADDTVDTDTQVSPLEFDCKLSVFNLHTKILKTSFLMLYDKVTAWVF